MRREQDTPDNLAHSHEDCSWPTTFYCAACGDTEVLVLGEICSDCRREQQAEADAAQAAELDAHFAAVLARPSGMSPGFVPRRR